MTARKKRKAENGEGTWYALADGRYRARIVIAGHPYEKESKSKAVVTSWLKGMRGKATADLAADAVGSATVREWMTYYFAEIAPEDGRCNSDTIDNYRRLYTRWCDPVIGAKHQDDVTAQDIRKIRGNMRKAGRAASTIRQATDAVLGRAFKVAIRESTGPRGTRRWPNASINPAKLVDGVTVASGNVKSLDEEQADAFVAAVLRLPRNQARWLLAIMYAPRQGECLGLTWEQINLDTGWVSIPEQLKRNRASHGCGEPTKAPVTQHNKEVVIKDVYPCGQRQPSRCPTPTAAGGLTRRKVKTKKSDRGFLLGTDGLRMMREHRAAQLKEQLALGSIREVELGGRTVQLVFTQPNGKPIDPRRDNEDFKALCAEAGIPGTTKLHQLRHTAITAFYEGGADDKEASELAGHSQVSFTRNQYEHVRQARRTRMAEIAERPLRAIGE